jgi:hypothetical protein
MNILLIDRWQSYCGICGWEASMYDEAHTTLLGFGSQNGSPGCGVRWTHVASKSYYPGADNRVQELRPDLIYVDILTSPELWTQPRLDRSTFPLVDSDFY